MQCGGMVGIKHTEHIDNVNRDMIELLHVIDQ